MKTVEFAGHDAESRLIAHVVRVETPALRDGGGVLVCGGSGGLREWIATDLASLAGGALVSEFIAVQVIQRVRSAGLGAVLFTAMAPDDVLTLVRSGEMAGNGWTSGEAGVEVLLGVVQRFVYVSYDGATKRLLMSSGVMQ
jgi:hypothetical protein